MKETASVHLIVKGTVQGVGFRFTTQRMAQALGIRGFVKNLYSGDVEIEAEGSRKALEELIERIKEHFTGYIDQIKIEWNKPEDNFSTFGIRF